MFFSQYFADEKCTAIPIVLVQIFLKRKKKQDEPFCSIGLRFRLFYPKVCWSNIGKGSSLARLLDLQASQHVKANNVFL
jgi:hypothetical protein